MHNDSSRTNAPKNKKLSLISGDTSHLVFGVFNTLEIDSASYLEEISLQVEDITIDALLSQVDGLLNHATLVYSVNNHEDYSDVIAGIHSYFDKRKSIKSESTSFTTWVLYHKENPIIEVTLFPHPDDNKVELLFNIRQYI